MSELPKVLRSWPQPSSGSGPKAAKALKEAQRPARTIGALQEIGFLGLTLTGESRSFTVLAGEGAPTPTEGWVKIAKVQRFQRASITVPEGYDPYVLSVPVLFDAVALTKDRPNVEADILALEWMAGRFRSNAELVGPPPQVTVYSTDSGGNLTNLVPKQFQTVNGSEQLWYLGPIAFDPNPLRDRGGERLRQAATITLTEVVDTASQAQEAATARAAVKGKFRTVRSTAAADTIKKVAQAQGFPRGALSKEAWKTILAANRNLGTSAEKKLRPGTKVKIPEELYRPSAR